MDISNALTRWTYSLISDGKFAPVAYLIESFFLGEYRCESCQMYFPFNPLARQGIDFSNFYAPFI